MECVIRGFQLIRVIKSNFDLHFTFSIYIMLMGNFVLLRNWFCFEIVIKCTLIKQMRRLNKWIMADENHVDSNCFALTIICHGNDKGHLLDKNKSLAWMTELFVADLSDVETLVGKPKIIVIQACRGCEFGHYLFHMIKLSYGVLKYKMTHRSRYSVFYGTNLGRWNKYRYTK